MIIALELLGLSLMGLLLALVFLQLNAFEKRVDAFCAIMVQRYKTKPAEQGEQDE